MQRVILSALLTAVLLSVIVGAFTGETRVKRSDGLIRDVVHQMVAEQLERKTLLSKFRKMENQLDDVKRELKERNTILHDTKYLQKKLEELVKDFKQEIRDASKADVKKSLDNFSDTFSSLSKNLRKDMKMLQNSNKKELSSTKHKIQHYVNLYEKNIELKVARTNERISGLKKAGFKRMELLSQELTKLQTHVANHTRIKKVAFTVMLNKQVTTSATLVFKYVISNIGGGYHSNDGIFYCPNDGIYMFSVTLQAYSNSYVQGWLMKNDAHLAFLFDGIQGNSYPTVSLTVTIPLKFGDKIWVKGARGYKYNNYSYFSGSLITL